LNIKFLFFGKYLFNKFVENIIFLYLNFKIIELMINRIGKKKFSYIKTCII